MRSVISFADYERIFEVIFGALDGRARTAHACLFFAAAGAFLLHKRYRISARPVVGGAAYLLDTANHTALFWKA